jgi:hypothetical protein
MGASWLRAGTQVRPCKNIGLDMVKQPWEPSLNSGPGGSGPPGTDAVPLFMDNSQFIFIRVLHQEGGS